MAHASSTKELVLRLNTEYVLPRLLLVKIALTAGSPKVRSVLAAARLPDKIPAASSGESDMNTYALDVGGGD